MNKISQTKQLISEINRLHRDFSRDYFETERVEKINLSRTIAHVPIPHIYRYRLTLHESVNDYLMTADIDIRYFYRVKTREISTTKLNASQPVKINTLLTTGSMIFLARALF